MWQFYTISFEIEVQWLNWSNEDNMAETPSTMIPLGTHAPDFNLLDTRSGDMLTLSDCQSGIATVVAFICNHCPYVKLIQTKLVEVANAYQAKGICFVAINSNDKLAYPQDGPEFMKVEAEKLHYPFPYLFDDTQEVAKAYKAACTPDFYIFDKDLKCVYRGRFDGATPGNGKAVTGSDLTAALDNILAGHPVSSDQQHSLGCNIKWRK
jgi:thiol-disulfide isomerase/thioredoxin